MLEQELNNINASHMSMYLHSKPICVYINMSFLVNGYAWHESSISEAKLKILRYVSYNMDHYLLNAVQI